MWHNLWVLVSTPAFDDACDIAYPSMYVMRARITYILTALGLTAATLGYAVPYTPTEALNGAMTDVVVALNEHGVIRLRPEIGLPPSTLVEFAAALGRARSGQECGFIASVPACSRMASQLVNTLAHRWHPMAQPSPCQMCITTMWMLSASLQCTAA